MDARAAKGIAANIRIIAEATTRIVLIDADVGCGPDLHTTCAARVECVREVELAQAKIAEWLQQPITQNKI